MRPGARGVDPQDRAGRATARHPPLLRTRIQPSAKAFAIERVPAQGRSQTCQDLASVEEPLELRIRGRAYVVTMRTPGHDAELAAGLLLAEGVVQHRQDIVKLAHGTRGPHAENLLNVFLAPNVTVAATRFDHRLTTYASCGLCGKTTIESIHRRLPPIQSDLRIPPARVRRIPSQLQAAQPDFALTGGLHGAALLDSQARVLVLREDIGRHNAVDKAIGHALLEGWLPASKLILAVTGRASFEILQKALAAGIPMVVALSAPSSLAIDFARASGQTLIGFLRPHGFNIYAGGQRIGRAKPPNAHRPVSTRLSAASTSQPPNFGLASAKKRP